MAIEVISETVTEYPWDYGRTAEIHFPELTATQAAFLFMVGNADFSIDQQDTNIESVMIQEATNSRADVSLFTKNFTTKTADPGKITLRSGRYTTLMLVVDGIGGEGVATTSYHHNTGYVTGDPFYPQVEAKKGQQTIGVNLQNYYQGYPEPESGYRTVLNQYIRVAEEVIQSRGAYISLILRDAPLADDGSFPGAEATFTSSSSQFRSVSLAYSPVTWTTFQIKHNGALIPATPHLWSGGQLSPIDLKLNQ